MGEIETAIDIQSGIRQGCTGSTILFKIVTYQIMEELEERGTGFECDMFNIKTLYYADDGLLLAHSKEQAIQNLQLITETSRKYGLESIKTKQYHYI